MTGDGPRIVVAGGGLSGSCVVLQLAARLRGPMSVLVVDDGSRPLGRAAWAFWSWGPHPLDRAVHAEYDRVRVVFHGRHVRTADPVFDPTTPTLLDFRTPQGEGASFVYVLPDGPREALVEHTTAFLPPSAPDPVDYACERIQRDAAAVAESLARHGHPFDVPGPDERHRMLDRALLGSLTDDPGLWERTIDALLDGPRTASAFRFLDEDTGPLEEARLFTALPVGRLVRAFARRRG